MLHLYVYLFSTFFSLPIGYSHGWLLQNRFLRLLCSMSDDARSKTTKEFGHQTVEKASDKNLTGCTTIIKNDNWQLKWTARVIVVAVIIPAYSSLYLAAVLCLFSLWSHRRCSLIKEKWRWSLKVQLQYGLTVGVHYKNRIQIHSAYVVCLSQSTRDTICRKAGDLTTLSNKKSTSTCWHF